MNALVLTNLFPSSYEPTRGLFNLHGFEALAKFCDVRVVVPVALWRRAQRPRDWGRTVSERHRSLVATYPTYWMVPRISMPIHAEAMYRSVRAQVRALDRQRRVDVILGAFAYPDAVAAARLARDLKIPFVAFVLGSDINELAQRPSLQPLIRAALRQASSVVAVSEGLRARVIELGISADRVIVQHNGVDGDCFRIRDRSEVRTALGVRQDERVVCFVGNLVHEKGPDVLVDAIGHLRRKDVDVSVVVIGDGPLRGTLAAAASALGVAARIRFLGRVPPEQVSLWLSAGDCLCLPSRREGCPNVVLEALACGRPVVASRVGGVPELLNEANGILATSGDPAALARGITDVLNRVWDPAALRASVPALSWTDLARTLHSAFSDAIA